MRMDFVKVCVLMLSEDELETMKGALKCAAQDNKSVQDCLFKVEEQLERFKKTLPPTQQEKAACIPGTTTIPKF